MPGSEELTADEFLTIARDYHLGDLETEKPHPLTKNLSDLAKNNLLAAFQLLKDVDRQALGCFGPEVLESVSRLSTSISECLQNRGKVFLAGCGATGRLSLALETFARQGMVPPQFSERFVGFMAGGDAALIRSIEGFEDIPAFGRKQLLDLGYSQNDLLIAITEGGETPWVIGACEAAAAIQGRSPWFCYCNPTEILRKHVERSRRVIDNQSIEKLCLPCGPMAVAGSTRMQASTVQMLAVGLAMLQATNPKPDGLLTRLKNFIHYFEMLSYEGMEAFTLEEEKACREGKQCWYSTKDFGLTVLTDTTERSPTFSLPPFENKFSPEDKACWCYLKIPDTSDSGQAWDCILRRPPRCLEWEECRQFTGSKWLSGYNIDNSASDESSLTIELKRSEEGLLFSARDLHFKVPTSQSMNGDAKDSILFDNLALKCLLNAHSTLLMGRLGRYEGNLMTYVRASNLKLIDRAIRYMIILGERKTGVAPAYADCCKALFSAKKGLSSDRPIVLQSLDHMRI